MPTHEVSLASYLVADPPCQSTKCTQQGNQGDAAFSLGSLLNNPQGHSLKHMWGCWGPSVRTRSSCQPATRAESLTTWLKTCHHLSVFTGIQAHGSWLLVGISTAWGARSGWCAARSSCLSPCAHQFHRSTQAENPRTLRRRHFHRMHHGSNKRQPTKTTSLILCKRLHPPELSCCAGLHLSGRKK